MIIEDYDDLVHKRHLVSLDSEGCITRVYYPTGEVCGEAYEVSSWSTYDNVPSGFVFFGKLDNVLGVRKLYLFGREYEENKLPPASYHYLPSEEDHADFIETLYFLTECHYRIYPHLFNDIDKKELQTLREVFKLNIEERN